MSWQEQPPRRFSSRRPKYHPFHPLPWIILTVVVVLFVGGCVYTKYIKTGTVTFTVTRLDDQASGGNHRYLVGTNKGVYQDTDNLFHTKFNSSDLYFSLKVGQRYTCTYTGYRVPVFSSYRNLLSCRVANGR